MSPLYSPQRRFPRIPSKNSLLIKTLDAPAAGRLARTQVLGLGGCMFHSDEPFGVGANLSLHIAVQERFIRALGRVAYENRRGDRYEVGVEFLEISDEEKDLLAALFRQPDEPVLREDPPLTR